MPKPKKRNQAEAAAPNDIFVRLRKLFVEDGQDRDRVLRTSPIFKTTNSGLGYRRKAFADRMEGPINKEFGCHNPRFSNGQLDDNATVGVCRDQIIADNGR
jgi:hypothetical protein